MKGVKQLQIYLINHAQKHGPKIFCLGVKAEYYVTNYNCSTTPEFVELLKSPKKPDKLYSIYPQVLFTNYEVIDKELFGSGAIYIKCTCPCITQNYSHYHINRSYR